MTYRKNDVQYHFDGPRGSRPAVNVKVRSYVTDNLLRKVAKEYGYDKNDAETFVSWWNAQADDYGSWVQECYDLACEVGWEDLQNDAEYIFGPDVKVYSEGRSGGWAVVHGYGLDNAEDWDAIALSRWARFEKVARGGADFIAESTAILALINRGEDYIRKVHEDARHLRFELAGVGL